MLQPEATVTGKARVYQRHCPENTQLYQLIQAHYPAFVAHLESLGRSLPFYVRAEFEDYLEWGRLEHGFLRVKCNGCRFERLVAFSCTNSRRSRREKRLLPQLWCSPNGRQRRPAGR